MKTPPEFSERKQTAASPHHQRLRAFASLDWYEEVIRFVFTFAAKTSEILLAAGLVVSTANFLTDGKVMGSGTNLATEWAWAQALAIDSSLGVTFYYVFLSIKDRDWTKVVCYGLLTTLLAVVAGAITNVDTFSHAIHIPIASAITEVGLDVKRLTTLRAIAVVGFVLMSRLKDVSFKELYRPTAVPPSAQLQETQVQTNGEEIAKQVQQLVTKQLSQQGRTVVAEELRSLLPTATTSAATISKEDMADQQTAAKQLDEDGQMELEDLSNDLTEEQKAKLLCAYQELLGEGKRISGRSLAIRAHLRRSTCNQWLATYHPEIAAEDPEE